MTFLNRAEAIFTGIVFFFTALVTVAMVALVIVSVVMRYVFNNPLVFSYDLSTLLFAWAVFLGLSLAEKENAHLSIDLFSQALSPRAALLHAVVKSLIVLTISVGAFWFGWKLLGRASMTIPSMRISIGWLYASLPAGFALLGIEQALKLGATLCRYRGAR
jgi:TRAP-type C4-dicarboxylate transport system permease small subunit